MSPIKSLSEEVADLERELKWLRSDHKHYLHETLRLERENQYLRGRNREATWVIIALAVLGFVGSVGTLVGALYR